MMILLGRMVTRGYRPAWGMNPLYKKASQGRKCQKTSMPKALSD